MEWEPGKGYYGDGIPIINMNTDGASPRKVLLQLLICAEAWFPEERIIGNIRAGDIKRAVEHYLYGDDNDDAISVQERA